MTYSGPMYGGFWGGYFGHGWGAPYSVHGGEIRTDTIVIVETLVYSLSQNKLVWGGQSKTTNPASVDRLIANAAKQARRRARAARPHRHEELKIATPEEKLMDARYKSIRTIVSAAIGIALTAVLLWGILDAGAAAL